MTLSSAFESICNGGDQNWSRRLRSDVGLGVGPVDGRTRQRERAMVKRTVTLFGIGAAVLASTAFGLDEITDTAPVVKRVAAEVAVNGVTPEEFFDRQRQLHDWLMTQVPEGLDRASVRIKLTDRDRTDIATPAVAGDEPTPMRVGVVKPVRERVGLLRGQNLDRRAKAAASIKENTEDGGFVWATTVSSPDAVAIRVHFADFSIPANAEVYFFSHEGEAYGPYVGAGPNDSGEFWSNSLTASTGIVLVRYYGPPADADLIDLSLRISDVAHVSLDFPRPAGEGGIASFCTYNASCVENATCGSTGAAAAAETAVAKMRWISGAFVYICSGGLLADTDGSTQIPYFLTANHCLSKDGPASNLEAYFHYQVSCGTSTCAGSYDPAPAPSTLGATVKATNRKGDFSLLELSQAPPAGSTFLGWNNSPIANTNGAALHRIHHPAGAPQAYSEHEVDTGAGTCRGWPRGERIYSSDVYGATEGGSSGSPVVNASGEVVGQLSGCCGFNCGDVCDSGSNSTVDGALAYYWDSVAPFLDPQGGGNPVCGDGSCDSGEDACNCPADCGGTCCGDGTCDPGEDSCNCQADCGGTCSCGGNKAPCNTNSDCCSNNCKNGSCKGN